MKKLVFIFIWISIFTLFACNQPKKINLKVTSYNIRHGVGMDNNLDLSKSAKVINSISPDLCGLQEIDNICLRSNNINQTKFLAKATDSKGTFGKFMDFQGGEYGMATLCKKPVISTKILQLPDGKYEPRSSIINEIEVDKNCTILFVNVHFDWVSEKEGDSLRLCQAKTLVKYLDKIDKATLIVGDFNCTPDSKTMKYFSSHGFHFIKKGDDNLSFQGDQRAEIDHIIYRNTDDVKILEKKIELLDEPLVSDHRPLVAELEVSYR